MPSGAAFVFPIEPAACFREHFSGGVEDGDLVAFAGQPDRLLAGAASHVGDTGRWAGKVFRQRAVDQFVADNPAQGPSRGVVACG
jgi:hypothetical protein